MKKAYAKVKILGAKYSIYKLNKKEDKRLSDKDGYCDFYQKVIVVEKQKDDPDDINKMQSLKLYENNVLRHEIIHAFLHESGLDICSHNIESWARDEEMIDWMALQFPKMRKIFKKLNIL